MEHFLTSQEVDASSRYHSEKKDSPDSEYYTFRGYEGGFAGAACKAFCIANIQHDFALKRAGLNDGVKIGISWRWQGETGDFCAQFCQPKREPSAFETGMAGDEDTTILIVAREHHQTFHGALPLFHMPVSNCCSR